MGEGRTARIFIFIRKIASFLGKAAKAHMTDYLISIDQKILGWLIKFMFLGEFGITGHVLNLNLVFLPLAQVMPFGDYKNTGNFDNIISIFKWERRGKFKFKSKEAFYFFDSP